MGRFDSILGGSREEATSRRFDSILVPQSYEEMFATPQWGAIKADPSALQTVKDTMFANVLGGTRLNRPVKDWFEQQDPADQENIRLGWEQRMEQRYPGAFGTPVDPAKKTRVAAGDEDVLIADPRSPQPMGIVERLGRRWSGEELGMEPGQANAFQRVLSEPRQFVEGMVGVQRRDEAWAKRIVNPHTQQAELATYSDNDLSVDVYGVPISSDTPFDRKAAEKALVKRNTQYLNRVQRFENELNERGQSKVAGGLSGFLDMAPYVAKIAFGAFGFIAIEAALQKLERSAGEVRVIDGVVAPEWIEAPDEKEDQLAKALFAAASQYYVEQYTRKAVGALGSGAKSLSTMTPKGKAAFEVGEKFVEAMAKRLPAKKVVNLLNETPGFKALTKISGVGSLPEELVLEELTQAVLDGAANLDNREGTMGENIVASVANWYDHLFEMGLSMTMMQGAKYGAAFAMDTPRRQEERERKEFAQYLDMARHVPLTDPGPAGGQVAVEQWPDGQPDPVDLQPAPEVSTPAVSTPVEEEQPALKRVTPEAMDSASTFGGADVIEVPVEEPAPQVDAATEAAAMKEAKRAHRRRAIPAYKSGTGLTPVLDFIKDHGGMLAKGKLNNKKGAGEYDAARTLKQYANFGKIIWGGEEAPDQMATALFGKGLIPDAYPDTLWNAIHQEIDTYRDAKARDELTPGGRAKNAERWAAEQARKEWAAAELEQQDLNRAIDEIVRSGEVLPSGTDVIWAGASTGADHAIVGVVFPFTTWSEVKPDKVEYTVENLDTGETFEVPRADLIPLEETANEAFDLAESGLDAETEVIGERVDQAESGAVPEGSEAIPGPGDDAARSAESSDQRPQGEATEEGRVDQPPSGEMFAVEESRREKVRGETVKPQVDQDRLLSGLTDAIAAGKAERAQGKLDLDAAPAASAGKVEVKGAKANLSREKQARLAELQKRMRGKLGQASMGVDPEILAIGAEMAALYVEGGVKTFAQFAHNMKADMGDAWDRMKRYLHGIWTAAGADHPDIDEVTRSQAALVIETLDSEATTSDNAGGETDNESDKSKQLEPGGEGAAATDAMGQGDVLDDGGAGRPGTGSGGTAVDESWTGPEGDPELFDSSAIVSGEPGDSPLHGEAQGTEDGVAGSSQSAGGNAFDAARPDAFDESDEELDGSSPGQGDLFAADLGRTDPDGVSRIAKQRAADRHPVRVANRTNIDKTLPLLHAGQREDVLLAETRFSKPDGYGMMFTNGTGTGKTYTLMGLVKRFVRRGKSNILIVVPKDSLAKDCIAAGGDLNQPVSQLTSTRDNGRKGVVVTTYANMRANETLADRDWDLVVCDECHYLGASQKGGATGAGEVLRAITSHPEGSYRRARMLHRAEYAKYVMATDDASRMRKDTDVPAHELARAERIEREQITKWGALEAQVSRDVEASQGAKRPRVVMLSATPFAYDTTIDYAEGYLFEYAPPGESRHSSGAYNAPNAQERFMMTHFGYRMRYGKLTKPDVGVDNDIMERQFNEWLREQGVLSRRMLDVEADYGRRFVMVEDGIGRLIDEGMEYLAREKGFAELYDVVKRRMKYHHKMYLLEALKVRHAIPVIKDQLAHGRKVVVFHGLNQGGGFHPFRFMSGELTPSQTALAAKFAHEKPKVVGMNLAGMLSPLNATRTAFGEQALFINGLETPRNRKNAERLFNDDDSGRNLIVCQSDAGSEGISLHDVTGKMPRIMIDLGLPVKPTKAMQQEGRTYRLGQHPESNAAMMYLSTDTSFERFTFASKIFERASTAENLAMGDDARGLRDSFLEAFADAGAYEWDPDDATGGKAADRQASIVSNTPFNRAKTFYYSREKRNSKTKSREGVDYFATPEPLGFKMVEWLGLESGEAALEPSAGHGAIARWLPANTRNVIVEPSTELLSKAALLVDARAVDGRFEDHDIHNKYHGIAMNPPFGKGGKTAVEHIAKAFRHLHDGGRLVAIIPEGPSADKRFDTWYEGDTAKDAVLMANISLPSVTFKRAGTGVQTRVVVIDRVLDEAQLTHWLLKSTPRGGSQIRATTIEELFDHIENLEMPDRVEIKRENNIAAILQSGRDAVLPNRSEGGAQVRKVFHTKKQTDIFIVVPGKRLNDEDFRNLRGAAKQAGGWYSRKLWKSPSGFAFESEEKANAFAEAAFDTGQTGAEDANLSYVREAISEYVTSRGITGPRAQAAVREQLDWFDAISDADGRSFHSVDADTGTSDAPEADQVAPTRRKRRWTKAHVAAQRKALTSDDHDAWEDAFRYDRTVSSVIHTRFTASPRSIPIKGLKVQSPRDVMALMMPLRSPYQESVKVLALSRDNTIISADVVSAGLLDGSLLHAREAFSAAVKKNAAKIYVVHNHPSGHVTPSGADVRMAQQLADAGRVLSIPVVDNIVTDSGKYFSIAEMREGSAAEADPWSKLPYEHQFRGNPDRRADWEMIERTELRKAGDSNDAWEVIRRLRNGSPDVGHVIMLGAQNNIVGVSRIDLTAVDGGVGEAMASATGEGNAVSIILDFPRPTADAIRFSRAAVNAGKTIDIPVLDVIDGARKSIRGEGLVDFDVPNFSVSGVAENRERYGPLAGDGGKLRGFVESMEANPDYAETAEAMKADPRAYYAPQSYADINERLDGMSNDQLRAARNEINDGLPLRSEDNFSVKAGLELMRRMYEDGEDISDDALSLAKLGTVFAQLLRQYGELKKANPAAMMAMVDSVLHDAGRKLKDVDRKALVDAIADDLAARRALRTAEEELKADFHNEDLQKKVKKLTKAAEKASVRLMRRVAPVMPRSVSSMLIMALQGNLLVPMSQVANVVGNASFLPLLFSAQTIGASLDWVDAAVTGRSRTMLAPWRGFKNAMKGAGKGTASAAKQMMSGVEPGAGVQGERLITGFHPATAIAQAFTGRGLPVDPETGKPTLSDRGKKVIEFGLGVGAEPMLRALNFGDKPFLEGHRARLLTEQGLIRGLQGSALESFVRFPSKEAMTLIEPEAREYVYQQQNKMANVVYFMFKQLENYPRVGPYLNVAAHMVVPYVKTPINLAAEGLQFAVPEISLMRAYHYMSTGQRRKAYTSIGKAATGYMMLQAAYWLASAGLLSGDPDKERAKARGLQYATLSPNAVNMSGLRRKLAGDDPTWREGDDIRNYTKLGFFGLILGVVANREATEADTVASDYLLPSITAPMETLQAAMGMTMLKGSSTLLTALESGRTDYWLSQMFMATSSIALPNTLAALNRATQTYLPETRGDTWHESFANAVRGKLFMTDDLPLKRDLFGRPIQRTPEGSNNWWYNLLDVTKGRSIPDDPPTREVARVYEATGDAACIPSVPARIRKDMLNAEYEEYLATVGSIRLELAQRVTSLPGYSSATPANRLLILSRLWRDASAAGKQQYLLRNPRFLAK